MIAIADKTQQISLTNIHWARVIEEFITNGQNPVKAYEIAYPECNTAPQAASRLFKNVKFTKFLNSRLGEIRDKTDRKVGELDAMYQKAYNLAIKHNQPAAAGSSVTGIARLYGLDKDNNQRDAVQIVINPPQTSPKRVESEIINE